MEYFSGPYFPVFELNTEIYRAIRENMDQKKLRIWALHSSDRYQQKNIIKSFSQVLFQKTNRKRQNLKKKSYSK